MWSPAENLANYRASHPSGECPRLPSTVVDNACCPGRPVSVVKLPTRQRGCLMTVLLAVPCAHTVSLIVHRNYYVHK